MSDFSYFPADPVELPMLPLRDVVVFPHMVIPLFVGRQKSIQALESAMQAGRNIMLVAQKSATQDAPAVDDMYGTGCIASILQLLKLPDNTVKVLVEGRQRAKVLSVSEGEKFFSTNVLPVPQPVAEQGAEPNNEAQALRRAVMQSFEQFVKLNRKIPQEILTSISSIDDAGRLADTIAAHLPLDLPHKQSILDEADVQQRLELLFARLEQEVDILNVDKRIRGRVKRQMEKNQRDFYLNEQVKAIQKELGEGEDGVDIEEIEKKIKAAKMPKAANDKAYAELKKLRLMSPMSAEAGVVRNYLEVLTGLPWSKKSKIKSNLATAEEVLNADHYGLERVKDRILEYLAVQIKSKRLFCAWWGRLVWVRPRWGSQSPKPQGANTCVWLWVACAMRLKFAGTAAPILALCRARCCKVWAKLAYATRCFCSMKSTNSARIFAATHPAHCLRCSTPSKTTPSTTTTLSWILT